MTTWFHVEEHEPIFGMLLLTKGPTNEPRFKTFYVGAYAVPDPKEAAHINWYYPDGTALADSLWYPTHWAVIPE